MRHLSLLLCLPLLSAAALAQAPPPLTPQMSPIVTWDPDRNGSRPPTQRALNAAELKVARARADRFYDVVKATPSFSTPSRHVTLVTAWPTVWDGAVRDGFNVYWSEPRDVLKRTDGSLWPKLGGAHTIAIVETNTPPTPPKLEDRATRGNFTRRLQAENPLEGAFAEPRAFGQVGGGTFYNEMLVITRDGRSVLEPAPVGPLLEGEIARFTRLIAQMDTETRRSLEELEASMTPQAKADRRARRADRWKTQFRNPTTLASELDAADRTDESDYQRQKERLTPPAARDPKSVYWGPRLATEAIEQRLASLDRHRPAGRRLRPSRYGIQRRQRRPVRAGCLGGRRLRSHGADSPGTGGPEAAE